MTRKPKPKAKAKAKPTAHVSRRELKRLAIEACADRRGRIHPDRVWQAARDPDHILHREFEWDLQTAAESHWRETASKLIRECKLMVVVEDRRYAAPYYVSDPRAKPTAYIPTARIAQREDIAERVLAEELARIEGSIMRARALAATFELQAHFERLLEGVLEIRRRLPSATPEAGEQLPA